MQDIPTSEVPVGARLARPVLDDKGRVLLRNGATLTAGVISRLEKWHVSAVCIEIETTTLNPEKKTIEQSPVNEPPSAWDHFVISQEDAAEAEVIRAALVLWRERVVTASKISDGEVSS